MATPLTQAQVSAPEIHAPEAWLAIDFISDLHLSEDTPKTFAALSDHLLNTPAQAVFILGDLFEVWVGDDARHDGFAALCTDVLAAASRRLSLAFMHGNRDFLLGSEMLQACGMRLLDDPTVLLAFGQRILLSHGDALCLTDLDYQRFRVEVRGTAWQQSFLSLPLAVRQKKAQQIRAESEARKTRLPTTDWVDLDPTATLRWMSDAATPTLIHGHTHRPTTELLAPGHIRHVLSDWDMDHATPPRADILRWQHSGFTRVNGATSRPGG